MSKNKNGFSRRSFLKWSAVAAGLSTSLTACGGDGDGETTVVGGGDGPRDNPDELLSGGEWVTVPCQGCPYFRCVNRAYMRDGIALRQKTADDHPFTHEYPQYRSCIKGRSVKSTVFSPARLKYPMKRVSWQPGGHGAQNAQNRGKEGWVRISWREALDTAASEFQRIISEYGGNSSVYGDADYGDPAKMPIQNLAFLSENPCLNVTGWGYMPLWGETSCGGSPTPVFKLIRDGRFTMDRFYLEDSELIVLWATNDAWSYFGFRQHVLQRAKERGAKIITVNPYYNPGNNVFADEWIPVRPGTDAALLLGVAYELITNRWVDKTFLDKYAVGYDRAHMPLYDKTGNPILDRGGASVITTVTDPDAAVYSPADPDQVPLPVSHHTDWKNNFKDYILGTFDGVPKTPEWASERCGTPVDKIKILAKAMGTIKPMAMLTQYASARTYHGSLMTQAYYVVGWLTGNVGKPGAAVATYNDYLDIAYGAPSLYYNPYSTVRVNATAFNPSTDNNPPVLHLPSVNPKADPAFGGFYGANNLRYDYASGKFYGIAITEIWQAILTGKFHHPTDIPGDDGIRNANIKGIIRLHSGGVTNQAIDTRGAMNALRKTDGVEFMLVMDKFFATDCRYADIVLPLVTWWEQDGHTSMSNPEMFIGNLNKIIEPLFEAREDSWADGEICKRFGYDPRNAATKARKQSTFETFMNMSVMQSDGSTYTPLIKFNSVAEAQALIDEQGVVANATNLYAGGAGLVTYDEFLKKGYYQTRVSAAMRTTKGSDGKGGGSSTKIYNFINQTAHLNAGFEAADHSSDLGILATETGKYEIYSMNFAKYYEIFRSTQMEPIPKWQAEPYGFDGAAEHPDYAYNNGYDMQFMSCHPHNRVHSVGGDNKYVLELFDDVLYMNPIDAEHRGLRNGETAKITTPPWIYDNLPADVKALALGSGGDRPEASLLRRVSVTNTIMPGVVLLPEGAMSRFDMDPEENIDHGGNPNSFALPLYCGLGQQTYNGFVVKIEKWTGAPLEPNYKWPANAPKFVE